MKLAESFPCRVEILKGNETINGKSILDLLTLGAGNGTTLTLRASGDGAESAVEALAKLIEGGFGEMAPDKSIDACYQHIHGWICKLTRCVIVRGRNPPLWSQAL